MARAQISLEFMLALLSYILFLLFVSKFFIKIPSKAADENNCKFNLELSSSYGVEMRLDSKCLKDTNAKLVFSSRGVGIAQK